MATAHLNKQILTHHLNNSKGGGDILAILMTFVQKELTLHTAVFGKANGKLIYGCQELYETAFCCLIFSTDYLSSIETLNVYDCLHSETISSSRKEQIINKKIKE